MFVSSSEHIFSLLREKEREREGEGEREKCERNIDWLPSICNPTRDQTCNLGKCPDRESNLQPFGVWDGTATN